MALVTGLLIIDRMHYEEYASSEQHALLISMTARKALILIANGSIDGNKSTLTDVAKETVRKKQQACFVILLSPPGIEPRPSWSENQN